jgi:hypothetical protein
LREVFSFDLGEFYNMKKRKANGGGDLRTNPIPLSLHRYMNLPLLRAGAQSYWNIEHVQPFFPPIECLFKSETLDFPNEYGIKFRNEIVSIHPDNKIRITSSPDLQDVHCKITMLLSPFKWMQGEYGSSIGLPTTSEQSAAINAKLQNPNNAAYVGSMISAVLSESGCIHFPKVYGVFTGISKSHTINISDDYEELSERPWFSTNLGKTFDLKLSNTVTKESYDFNHTRAARALVQLGEDTMLDDVETLETTHVDTTMADLRQVMDDDAPNVSAHDDSSSSVSTDYIFAIHSCDCDEEDREIIDEMEDETDTGFAWATFANVPVQITAMEKCEGTFYTLMMAEVDLAKQIAWLTQVIFALAYAQRNFGFVHNDLHSNNVMYVKTNKEFLYYNAGGVLYKVPTYGYVIKIIDFERGTASIKLTGMKEAKFFMSDHFSSNDEAGGQYNYEPFYNAKYPEVKPNASFDLVRLTTSLFWDFFPEGPQHEGYRTNLLFNVFMKWLTLEDGSSILFGNEEPQHDRYHGFTLYKAIARYCKDTAVPRKEFGNLKEVFGTTSIPLGETALLIES